MKIIAKEKDYYDVGQYAFGYTDEDLRMILEPMAVNGEEPVGCGLVHLPFLVRKLAGGGGAGGVDEDRGADLGVPRADILLEEEVQQRAHQPGAVEQRLCRGGQIVQGGAALPLAAILLGKAPFDPLGLGRQANKLNYSEDGKCYSAGRELPSVIPLSNDRTPFDK